MLLADLQGRFVNSIIGTGRTGSPDPQLLDAFKIPPPQDPIHHQDSSYRQDLIHRFEIHINNYYGGLTKALSETYPVCHRLVGERFFSIMAKHYIQQYDSKSFSFYDYGQNLAEFMIKYPPLNDLVYLPDVATLEWRIHRALLGPHNTAFDFLAFQGLSSVEQNDIIFHLAENASLLQSPYPINKIWETNQAEYCGDTLVDLQTGPVFLIIFRKDFLHMDSLSSFEWQILNWIQAGFSIKNIFTLASSSFGKEALRIKDIIPNFIQRGYIN